MKTTDYHDKFFARELTGRYVSDGVERLEGAWATEESRAEGLEKGVRPFYLQDLR